MIVSIGRSFAGAWGEKRSPGSPRRRQSYHLWARVKLRDALCRDLGVAVRGLARCLLPAPAGPGTLAPPLRRSLPDRRPEQLLLPASRGLQLRPLAQGDP